MTAEQILYWMDAIPLWLGRGIILLVFSLCGAWVIEAVVEVVLTGLDTAISAFRKEGDK